MAGLQQVLVGGRGAIRSNRLANCAHDPATGEAIGPAYPVSGRREVEEAAAYDGGGGEFSAADPRRIAAFLDGYAAGIEAEARRWWRWRIAETGLPASPRLREVELPRTTGQLRQAARAVRGGLGIRWSAATGLRAAFGPLGKPVRCSANNFRSHSTRSRAAISPRRSPHATR